MTLWAVRLHSDNVLCVSLQGLLQSHTSYWMMIKRRVSCAKCTQKNNIQIKQIPSSSLQRLSPRIEHSTPSPLHQTDNLPKVSLLFERHKRQRSSTVPTIFSKRITTTTRETCVLPSPISDILPIIPTLTFRPVNSTHSESRWRPNKHSMEPAYTTMPR